MLETLKISPAELGSEAAAIGAAHMTAVAQP
jgi:hypothetical protein